MFIDESKLDEQQLILGAGILLANSRAGIIRYRGPVDDEKGEWFGVELIAGAADKRGNNGMKAKKRYFFAPKGRAVFVQREQIRKVLSKNSRTQNFNIVDPAERIEARAPKEWTTSDVARWLSKIKALEAVTIFIVHNINGTTLLKLSREDLQFKLGIKDKNLITKIMKSRQRLIVQSALLPNVGEGEMLELDDYKDEDGVIAPDFLDDRQRAKSSPLLKGPPKKRYSYSVPERLRGKLPSPRDKKRRSPRTNALYPPSQGSLRGIQLPKVARFISTPARAEDVMLHYELEEEALPELNLLDLGDQRGHRVSEGDKAKHHRRSESLSNAIESTPMDTWECGVVAKWVNSLGGSASNYGDMFRNKRVTGSDMKKVNSEGLDALGVVEPGVRKWILTSRDNLLFKQGNLVGNAVGKQ